MQQKKPVLRRLIGLVASSQFFWVIVGIFGLQAAWIALTGRYPMAFDENFHLGIIRLYAHHLSPFWSGQPAGGDAFGAVARDPSYLYQYLMSFPYRLISVFTHDQTIQVIILRFINIILFGASLPIFRRLLLKIGASRGVVHLCLLLFVLLPIVPLLAAQINYDNLLIPVVGLVLLEVTNFSDHIKKSQPIDVTRLLAIIIGCLLASLIKYAFLAVFMATIIYMIIRLRQVYDSFGVVRTQLTAGARLVRRQTWVLLIIGLIISGGLFGERYGINLVRYHAPVPACGQVLSVKACSAYGPWARDYSLELSKSYRSTTKDPITFTSDWLYGMWLRTFFAVDGPDTDFQTRGPLPVPALTAIVFVVAGVLSIVVYGRRLLRQYNAPLIRLLALVEICYIGALWLDEYRSFLQTGDTVAINGRYLLPVVLPLLVIGALALKEALKHFPAFVKPLVAGLAVLSLVWGGGALTYILRSNDAWYWPSPVMRDANHVIKNVLKPITPGYNDPIEFL